MMTTFYSLGEAPQSITAAYIELWYVHRHHEKADGCSEAPGGLHTPHEAVRQRFQGRQLIGPEQTSIHKGVCSTVGSIKRILTVI